MIDKGMAEGFISEEVRRLLIADDNIENILTRLETEYFTVPEKLG